MYKPAHLHNGYSVCQWSGRSGSDSWSTQKMVLDDALLNTQHYKVWIMGLWSNPGKGTVHSPTPQYGSYWKRRLWSVNLYIYMYIYAHTHTHTHTYIYIYIYIYIYNMNIYCKQGFTENFWGWPRYSTGMWLKRLIFKHNPSCDPCTFSIGFAVLGSDWLKSQHQIWRYPMDFQTSIV